MRNPHVQFRFQFRAESAPIELEPLGSYFIRSGYIHHMPLCTKDRVTSAECSISTYIPCIYPAVYSCSEQHLLPPDALICELSELSTALLKGSLLLAAGLSYVNSSASSNGLPAPGRGCSPRAVPPFPTHPFVALGEIYPCALRSCGRSCYPCRELLAPGLGNSTHTGESPLGSRSGCHG